MVITVDKTSDVKNEKQLKIERKIADHKRQEKILNKLTDTLESSIPIVSGILGICFIVIAGYYAFTNMDKLTSLVMDIVYFVAGVIFGILFDKKNN